MAKPNKLMTPERIATMKLQYACLAPSPVLDLIADYERLTAGLGELEKRWRDKAELIAMPGTRARMLVMCNELAVLLKGE